MNPDASRKAWLWGPVVAWASMVFVLLSLPVEILLALLFPVSEDPTRWMVPYSDKFVHALLFGVMAWLLFRPLSRGWRIPPVTAAATAFIVSSLYGLSMEFVQSFLPYRQADMSDVAANAAGAAFVFLWPALARKRPMPAEDKGT